MVKDIRLDVRVRNNLILVKMESAGIKSVSELAKRLECSKTPIYKLVNMQMPACNKDGSWCAFACKLADFFRCVPEQLFSEEQQQTELDTNRSYAEIAFSEVQNLLAGERREHLLPDQSAELMEVKAAIDTSLNSLPPRLREIICRRFGLHGYEESTLEEIGVVFHVSRDRIRQLEARALRYLRNPSRSDRIKAAAFDDAD